MSDGEILALYLFFFSNKTIFKIFITVRAESLFYFTAKINSQFKVTSSDFLIVLTVYYEIFFIYLILWKLPTPHCVFYNFVSILVYLLINTDECCHY